MKNGLLCGLRHSVAFGDRGGDFGKLGVQFRSAFFFLRDLSLNSLRVRFFACDLIGDLISFRLGVFDLLFETADLRAKGVDLFAVNARRTGLSFRGDRSFAQFLVQLTNVFVGGRNLPEVSAMLFTSASSA